MPESVMVNERELSIRAVVTGTLLGILLTPSNVYAGLKIGWSFNMSIIALLIGIGVWQGGRKYTGGMAWTIHESNINQTVASAAASIVSGGLVAPIPAYTLLTGQALSVLPMIAWVFAVSFLGIWLAWYLRPSLLNDPDLKFPEGMATLETLTHLYSNAQDASKRLAALLGAAFMAGLIKWVDLFLWKLPRWSPSAALERLTFTVDPSFLLLGFGGIIGMRVGMSLLAGALLAWGGLAPWLIAEGLVKLKPGSTGQFAALVEWLLWPGVSLMVCATLSTIGLRFIAQRKTALAKHRTQVSAGTRWLPVAGMATAIVLVVFLQSYLFGIDVLMALLTIPLALFLAAVAARIVGATGIPPIGAIGKISQLSLGMVAPGQVAINLMGANTAGGAAGQCTDLMNDFKVGKEIHATPWKQLVAQCLGITIGSVVGVLAYKALIPDPRAMLLTETWPAPAAATWKAVAQTLSYGIDSLSASVRWSILLGGLAGIALGVLDFRKPGETAFRPSPAAFGLAFVLPASVSMMMAAGALLTWLVSLWRPGLTERFALAIAAGLIAGESMTGVGASLWNLFRGG
jgi:putative OPT family oligopeptide transporter